MRIGQMTCTVFSVSLLSAPGWAQLCQQGLLVSDAAAGDGLGGQVVTNGSYAALSAPGQVVNGIASGSVYIHDPQNPTTELAQVVGSNAGPSSHFGASLDLEGDELFVGAPGPFGGFGEVYVFSENTGGAGAWGESHLLTNNGLTISNDYGRDVAASGDTLAVAATISGIGGVVDIRERDRGGTNTWGLVTTVSEFPDEPGFARSIDLDGDTLVVGAPFSDRFSSASIGAVYIYERDHGGPNNWGGTKFLRPPGFLDPDDRFGWDVDVSGDRLIVSAIFDDDEGSDAGAVYVFERDQGGPGNWGMVTKITASDGEADDYFGWDMELVGTRAAIGMTRDDNPAIYVLEEDWAGPGAWGEAKRLQPIWFLPGEGFGATVGLSADYVVGASPNSSAAGSSLAGAAYLFDLDSCYIGMPFGFCHTDAPCGNTDAFGGCANVNGVGARLFLSGTNSVAADDLVLTATGVPAGQVGRFFMGQGMNRYAVDQGLRVVTGPTLRRYPLQTATGAGIITLGPSIIPMKNVITVGTTWNFQLMYRDPNGPCPGGGVNWSHGISVSFLP